MSRVPQQYRKLLKDPQAMRNFFLKPAGLDVHTRRTQIPKAGYPPKITPTVRFVKDTFTLIRPNKYVEDTTLSFRTAQHISKPQIRQYFEKLYGVNIKNINTVRFMGKTYRTHTNQYRHSAAFKKVYLQLQEKVDPFLIKSE